MIETAVAAEAHAAAAEVAAPSKGAAKRLRPVVGYPVAFGVTPALRDLPAAPAVELKPDQDPREINNPSLAGLSRKPPIKRVARPSTTGDAAIYAPPAPTPMDPPILTFEGVNNAQSGAVAGGFVYPPDTNGDVGPNHYVQTVNLAMRVFNRNGTPATPVFLMSSLFASIGGACATSDDGDPIVLYDHLADRWLVSQFAFPTFPNPPYFQCIAISQTADPTGPYFAYSYTMPGGNLNDYPHFGVWHDAYYMTDNQFFQAASFSGAGNFAFDRAKMLAGDPTASFIYFDLFGVDPTIGGMLPSDLDGPGRVRPNIFSYFTATEFGDPQGDGLRLFEFVPNFTTPASSTFTELPFLPVAAFDPITPTGRADIPQPGTAIRLDSIGDRVMHRLQYRNYGTHESLTVAHTVDASGDPSAAVYRAGVRYYELRRPLPAGGPWTVREQATFAPADTVHRWMPSAAMDNDGNLAVGFSVSDGTSVFPGIRYAGRLAADPPGLAQGEAVLQAGTGVQTGSANRWGDYSMLAVDPVDDCTFWFTTEYYTPAPGPGCTGGGATICWQTRVGTFRFPSCTPPAGAGTITGTVTDSVTTAPVPAATVTATGGYTAITNASGVYSMSVPAGTYDVTATKAGYSSATATGQVVTTGGTTTVNLAITGTPTLVFVSRTIDDSAGNGNGNIDPNECIATVVTLRNTGGAPATGISATLTTSTPNVTITTGTSAYPDIAPGATGANGTPFRFQTSSAFLPGTTITFTLTVTTAQGPSTVNFTMPSGTPDPVAMNFNATGPVPIPDNNPAGANLNVTVSGLTTAISRVRVSARITHTWDADIALSVRGPDGTTVQLSNNRGGSGDNYGTDCPADDGDDTIFDDAAANPISAGVAPFVGSFRPEQPLAAFIGKAGPDANGTWVFRVVDSAAADVGNIECVTITINGFSTALGPGGCGPTLGVNDVTVVEGAVNANFTVTLTPAAAAPVTVQYATANGTATAGADYTTASGMLTFAAGVTSQPVMVPVLSDTLDEANETFMVNLSSATGPAALGDAQGVGTIMDDDPSPSLAIVGPAAAAEGTGASPTVFQFNVNLAPISGQSVTVDFSTADGTATQPGDYATASGTLTFNPGTTTLPVFVNVVADPLDEPNETFTVGLTNATNATIGTPSATGTINDDDISYYAVTPCRIVDTRGGPPLAAGTTTDFTVTGGTCAVPADAAAVMINVTVVQQTDFGNLRVYPNGQTEPLASTINFVVGRTRANNAIVPVGTGGQLRVKVDMAGTTGTTQLVLDVFGYFK